MKKKPKSQGQQFNMRMQPETRARIAKFVTKHPVVTQTALVRAAIQIGLDAIERDPSMLLGIEDRALDVRVRGVNAGKRKEKKGR